MSARPRSSCMLLEKFPKCSETQASHLQSEENAFWLQNILNMIYNILNISKLCKNMQLPLVGFNLSSNSALCSNNRHLKLHFDFKVRNVMVRIKRSFI